MSEPVAEQLRFPPAYGVVPKNTLQWSAVRERLESSMRYWLVTHRPDGRAHVVPLDGVWLDDRWYHGGAPETVHLRNLEQNPWAVLHLEDAMRVVVVEGSNEFVRPSRALAKRLAEAANAKYGYSASAASYSRGTWVMTPTRVMAWEEGLVDPTRFLFTSAAEER